LYYFINLLLDFIYRGSLVSIFTTLIYHKVLINNKTEQYTEQDKQTNCSFDSEYFLISRYTVDAGVSKFNGLKY